MSDNALKKKPLPPALPETAEDFLRLRHLKSERTLNDQVEDIHLSLCEDQVYKRFLYAVYDEQAVEGSLSYDDSEAATIIREKAKKIGNDEVAREKKATIAKALRVVLSRYHQSRKERRNMIGGEVQPNDGGE